MKGLSNESNIILKLFKLVFGSLGSYPLNESFIKPYLKDIIKICLNNSTQNKESTNFFLTLRNIFRTIGTGKFEALSKEFISILPQILDKITDLLKGSYQSPIRDLFIELCLTVPAKIQVLCAYLPLLIRPVLFALQGNNSEIISLAFRNLDHWVDSLRADSLEPVPLHLT
jgi:transformation/transcription domain-associated protein